VRINRWVLKLILVGAILALIGVAIFPDRTPDEIAAVVGIPLTIYFLLPLFLVHLLPLDKPQEDSRSLREIFARAKVIERVILSLLLFAVAATYAGIIMAISAAAHTLVSSPWGQQFSLRLAFWLLGIGGGTIAFILGGLYLLRMILRGIIAYLGDARRVIRRSAEWLVSRGVAA